MTPVEPPPSRWDLPHPAPGDDDVIAIGGHLEPGTVLDAYRRGLFPMRIDGRLAWWSPDPRGVIPLDGFHVSRSLRPAIPTFEVRVDTAFEAVMRAFADPRRAHVDRIPADREQQRVCIVAETHLMPPSHKLRDTRPTWRATKIGPK